MRIMSSVHAGNDEGTGDCLMAKALYIEETNEDYDLNLPPTSGEEYLRRVQIEAKQCPNVMVAPVDVSQFSRKQTITVTSDNGCAPPPKGYKPSIDWQKKQLADFSGVRLGLIKYKAKLKQQTIVNKRYVKLPAPDDYQAWCGFCFGKRKVANDPSLSLGCSDDTESPNPGHKGMPPLVSTVTEMSQPVVEKVFDHQLRYFAESGFTSEQGQWFYALLASLEKPLTPETCSALRTLARLCANLRATLPEDAAHLVELNLLICLVSRYFNQYDLADSDS